MKFYSNHLGWSWSWRNRNFCKPVSNGTKRSKSCYYESFERWNWGNPNTCWLLGGNIFHCTLYLKHIQNKLLMNFINLRRRIILLQSSTSVSPFAFSWGWQKVLFCQTLWKCRYLFDSFSYFSPQILLCQQVVLILMKLEDLFQLWCQTR